MAELERERVAEDDFTDWVQELPYPAIALKLALLGLRGWPDRTVLCKGQILFIEFKRPGEPLRTQQETWKRRLKRLGFNYAVCTSKAMAIRAFHKYIKV